MPTIRMSCSTSRQTTRRQGRNASAKATGAICRRTPWPSTQYEGLYGDDRVRHVCCWAHARRKFVAAAESKVERAEVALALIRQLYAIERDLSALLPPTDDPLTAQQLRQREEHRRQRRRQHAEPILVELKKWLDQERPKALPKSPLRQAIGYALNNG